MEQNAFDVLRERGFVYQCTAEDEVRELLGKEKVRFYVGFDPTGNSLHVGHLLPVMAMRIMQKCGHTPIVLVGGATALVGDPSGRSTERPILTKETVANNVECLKSQLQRFISVDNAIFTNNADWFGGMLYLDFLRDIGSKFSVNRMLQAESVQMRLNSEVGVSFLEFNYMILQGYDFLHLYRTHGCRLQLGGAFVVERQGVLLRGLLVLRLEDIRPPPAPLFFRKLLVCFHGSYNTYFQVLSKYPYGRKRISAFKLPREYVLTELSCYLFIDRFV